MATEADTPFAHDPLLGTRVGEYEVLEVVGEGGMGVVYRAVHTVIKKRVAIKVLKPAVAEDATHVKRLIAEAEAVNAIGHRNIVDIFGLGQLPDGRSYIVMEFLEGLGLDVYLAQKQVLPFLETLSLLNDIAAPLAAAHRAGVVHRDLKPSNVFLCEHEGQRFVKLLDFGLAKRALSLDGTSAQTSQASIAGTPDYMAPEQARGLAVSPRTDLYSLGVMAWEMVTGALPFSGNTPMDVMMAQVNAPVPALAAHVEGLPPRFDALVARLLAKEPDDRPGSVDEVRVELQSIATALAHPLHISKRIAAFRVAPDGSLTRARPSAGARPTPATPMPFESLAPGGEPPTTVVREPLTTAHRSRWPFAVAGAAAAALGGLVWWVMEPGQVARPAAVVSAPPVSPVLPLDVGSDAGAAASERPPSGVASDDAELHSARGARVPKSSAPTPVALRLRAARLERLLRAQTAHGDDVDPTALSLLDSYRVKATVASTPNAQKELNRKLDSWEATYLKRR